MPIWWPALSRDTSRGKDLVSDFEFPAASYLEMGGQFNLTLLRGEVNLKLETLNLKLVLDLATH